MTKPERPVAAIETLTAYSKMAPSKCGRSVLYHHECVDVVNYIKAIETQLADKTAELAQETASHTAQINVCTMLDGTIRRLGEMLTESLEKVAELETRLAEARANQRTELDLRPEVLWFANEMEKKLKANDHKPGWKNEPIDTLLWQLDWEIYELNLAKDSQSGISEAADVANFAMMIADIHHRNLAGKKGSQKDDEN